MFNTIRNWFNKPRLTLMQRWNVATLLTLLEDLPAENYDHVSLGFSQREYADRGCAMGLALANSTEFYTPHPNPTLKKLGFCKRRVKANREVAICLHAFGGSDFTGAVSSLTAFSPLRPSEVTKKMVIDRLKAYAYEGYRA